MIKKSDASVHIVDSTSIQVNFHLDLSFLGLSLDACFTHNLLPDPAEYYFGAKRLFHYIVIEFASLISTNCNTLVYATV